MKPKTTIILLVIALLIGGFVWYDQTHLKDTTEVQTQKKRVFPGIKSSGVTRLELHNTNGVIVAEKSGDKWDMKQPYATRANKSMVDAILSDLEFLDAERALSPTDLKEANASLGSYGLEKPRIEATFTLGGKTQTIKLGDDSKVGGNVYAMVAGRDNVYLIPKRLAETLGKTVDDMRDRSVIEFASGQLSKLEFKSGNRQIELTKTENAPDATEGWRITRPILARADRNKVNDIATKLSELKVETFVTEEPKDLKLYGLDEPPQEVTLFTKSSDGAQIVQFGAVLTNDTTKVYAKRKAANSIFTVKNDILSNLVFQVNDLRDRSLAAFEADQVNTVDLWINGQAIKLSHRTNAWEIVEPSKLKPDTTVCDDLLQHIHDAEIKEFAADVVTDLTQYGLDKPACEITLRKENASAAAVAKTNEVPKTATATNAVAATTSEPVPLLSIQVGKTDAAKGIVYVKRGDEPFVYGLGTNFVAELPKSLLDLRDRAILETDAATIQKLEVTRGSSQFVTERVPIKGTNAVERKEWKLVTPGQGVLASEAVDDLVSSLAQVKAEKLVAENPADLARFGLAQPALIASFSTAATTNSPALTYALLVGSEGQNKRHFAMLRGKPFVFELDTATYERLTKDFVVKPEEKPVATTNHPPATATPPAAANTNQPPAQAPPSAPAGK